MGLLAGCGLTAVAEPAVADGLECADDTRVGWAIDRGEPVAGYDSPEAAVRGDVSTGGGDLIVGKERDRGDVVEVEVIVERDGRAQMRVTAWKIDRGWLADNVEACG
jgi:hypothetical protein